LSCAPTHLPPTTFTERARRHFFSQASRNIPVRKASVSLKCSTVALVSHGHGDAITGMGSMISGGLWEPEGETKGQHIATRSP
jgi:hypothetical protein